MKIRLNWGYRLLIFTVLFMVFIISMVSYMMNQRIDLVDADYYEKGIRYQSEIDESKNSARLLDIQFHGGDAASFSIESHVTDQEMLPVSIHFYRPSDQSLDFVDQVFVRTGEVNHFPLTGLEKGAWKATFIWKDGKGSHRFEQSFTR